MVDVVVDEKPRDKLPYDPNDIPEAVRKRVAAVEALYQSNGSNGAAESDGAQPSVTPEQPQSPEGAPATPQVSVSPDLSPPTPSTPAPADSTPPPSEDENSQSWKHRYLGMEGRYNASQKTIGEQQEQMVQMGNELLHWQRLASQSARPTSQQASSPAYLTEQDVQNYGSELIDVTQRAALHAVAPKLTELEQQNRELQQRLAKEARRALDQAVEIAVPNYREIDRNPRWHNWLLGIDVLSGRVRQVLLNEAISAANAPRAISFFKSFLAEEVATGHRELAPTQQVAPPREAAIDLATLAAPGRARPATGGDASLPANKPVYTHARIKELYELKRKGAYVGRETEWARQEADIYVAQREGRVRN